MKRLSDITQTTTPMLIAAILLVVGVVAYLYFLNLSVVHVVMRKEATHQQSVLRAEIATLETQYIEAQHAIAARIATLEGYNTETEKLFVTRGENSLVLNAN